MEAGPWLLSGVKAEPVQVAEPPWKGLLGDGNSWTSPRHCWKGQQMEAASGQILTWPFLPAVLQRTGSQVGLPFPWPPCLWWARAQKTSLSSSTHPPTQCSSALSMPWEAHLWAMALYAIQECPLQTWHDVTAKHKDDGDTGHHIPVPV